ncbi:MAG: pentapeptide repeat-containing protein [Bacteroidetes bacterium]|nr:pentapeptide repeat-containing protein [Bacteroidota bacterium]
MQEVDFSQADLSGSFFINCDLSRAVFDGTNLEKSDLRTSYNFTIDPERNKIKKARFSNAGLAGLLGKYDIIIE